MRGNAGEGKAEAKVRPEMAILFFIRRARYAFNSNRRVGLIRARLTREAKIPQK